MPRFSSHLHGEQRADRAAEVHQGVVDRVAERLGLRRRRARHGADDGGLDERAADRGDDQRHDHVGRSPERVHQRLARRQAAEADQKVADAEDREAGEEALLEAVAVDDGAGERRQEVEQRIEQAADQEAGLARAETYLLGDVDRQDRLRAVVGEALEQLDDVGDPEGAGESGLRLLEKGCQSRSCRFSGRRNLTGSYQRTRCQSLVLRHWDEKWSGREDLNLRPHGPEPCALPS